MDAIVGGRAMKDWTALLRREIPSPCYDRPFVCDGFPSESNLMVIGENPGTSLCKDWWSYWSAETGFDYEAFALEYEKEKETIRGTRLRLNRIRENNVRCIETNVYRNEKPDGAGKGELNISLLQILIEFNENLKSIIVHGDEAQTFLDRLTLPEGVLLYLTRHFRVESYDEIDRICADIKSLERHTYGT